ncbi:hypothetical protein MMC11_005862 [Xylographa trunciseda]|nr:hypothetical protein [Xylographa trunciseda]
MYTTLILDLGDVLFHWSPVTQTAVLPQDLKKMVSSSIWSEYERGYFSEERCCEKLGRAFNYSAIDVRDAMGGARSSFQLDQSMYTAICELQKAYNLQVVIMSNISAADYIFVRNLFPPKTIFDNVFISGTIGMRKPDVQFFSHVLERINADPHRTIFVDDKVINVMSAQSLGIKALVCKNTPDTIQELRSTLDHSVKLQEQIMYTGTKGVSFLVAEAESFEKDWSQVQILELDTTYMTTVEHIPTFNPT